MVLIFAIIPFILFLLFHFLYIKAGLYIAAVLDSLAGKIVFWLVYGSFGIILVYTDYIWRAYPAAPEYENPYRHYSETNTSGYDRLRLHGAISPGLKVVFSAYLRSDEPRCIKDPKARYASVNVTYPAVTSETYQTDLFREYADEKSGCRYRLETLFVELYRKDPATREAGFDYKITDRYFAYEQLHFSDPGHAGDATIVCSEVRASPDKNYPLNTLSRCRLVQDRNASTPDAQNRSIRLDINASGAISGLSALNVKRRWALSDALQKFQIADYPAH